MSDKVIVFKNDEGGISIIHPTTTVELAVKDVPAGKAYAIMNKADVPSDRTFRNAWTIDDSLLVLGTSEE